MTKRDGYSPEHLCLSSTVCSRASHAPTVTVIPLLLLLSTVTSGHEAMSSNTAQPCATKGTQLLRAAGLGEGLDRSETDHRNRVYVPVTRVGDGVTANPRTSNCNCNVVTILAALSQALEISS